MRLQHYITTSLASKERQRLFQAFWEGENFILKYNIPEKDWEAT